MVPLLNKYNIKEDDYINYIETNIWCLSMFQLQAEHRYGLINLLFKAHNLLYSCFATQAGC